MTKDEALDLALEELENCADLLKVFDAPIDSCVGASMLQAEKAITSIKQARSAQPAPVREPVALHRAQSAISYTILALSNGNDLTYAKACLESALTAIKQALAAPVQSCYCPNCEAMGKELAALKAQQPVQEPVAWMYQCTADNSGPVLLRHRTNWAESGTGLWTETPLYTTPTTQPAPVQEPVKFLAKGARFKTSEFPYGVCINGLPKELSGRWVALVAAEDDCHLQLTTPPAKPAPVQELPLELRGVRETVKDGGGFWRSCTGCHELNEGHATGPFSKVFGCALGNGCSECGGIGAIWDDTDYEEMARTLDEPTQPAAQPAVPLTDEQKRDLIKKSALWDMHIHIGWYSAPAKSFVEKTIQLIADIEAAHGITKGQP
jgi:hypothetical protein